MSSFSGVTIGVAGLSNAVAATSASRVGPAGGAVNAVDRLNDKLDPRPETVARASDQVELSSVQRPVNVVSGSQTPGVRDELVRRVRAEIAAGTYDTPEKFDLAVRRAVRELDVTG
jgi:anti-sigma28 factor (negative regulator of flagellin synthesis)